MPKDYSLDMDAIAAHLDRGWDLLHQGDLPGARVSAGHILRINNDSPEGHTLMGAIAAAEGDLEEALDSLRQAMDLDPEYLDAILYAAELALHNLGDLDYGLRLCDEAAELAVEPGDRTDIGLMRAEAHLLAGDRELAARALSSLPPPPYADPAHALRAGRVHLEVGSVEVAVDMLQVALEAESCRADGHYFMGVALEQLERPAEALEHFIEARELDRSQPAPPWAATEEQLSAELRELVGRLPQDLAEGLESLPMLVLEFPPVELVAEGFDPRGLVFISGHGHGHDEPARPSGVFVYKGNLEQAATSRADLSRTLEQALRQELELFRAGAHPGE
jgi:tetratricopeptide (TPR) repeat protein